MLFRHLHIFVITILKLSFLRSELRIPAMVLLGLFCGMGLLLAHISRTTTYMIDSPDTCMNCHVMTDSYASRARSAHGRGATCNDCHVPHTSLGREYMFKAYDGLRHAAIFTLRLEPQVMHLATHATPVVQENCIRCHEERVAEVSANNYPKGEQRCWDCHRDVAHGRVHSLSASPDVLRPKLPSVMELPPFPPISALFGKGNENSEHKDWKDDPNTDPE